jgi:EAL domain-containing protein (putative c-di-GMP-specific phosphodiesterase class I)
MVNRVEAMCVSVATRSSPGVATLTAPPDLDLDGAPTLMFQPAVDLATGRLLGFEALLRWRDPSGGSIAPDALIPWAEAHGFMEALNAWVLSEACAQAARWPSDLQIAVNCSVFQVRRGEAASAAASALERSRLTSDRLTVEVTETALDDDEAAAGLHALARMGIQLTVDDVGADWSVLERMRECVNTMKIDGTVVAELAAPDGSSQAVVETITALCRSLGICTVAEAVETEQQVSILRELGVDVAQGYFFSPPLSDDDANYLASMNPLPVFALTLPDAFHATDQSPGRPS